MKRCAKCGQEAIERAPYCHKCGAIFEGMPLGSLKACGACKGAMPYSASVCPWCSSAVEVL
jgi:RNA polymerase subunit RPABC4/transcription elongation factor Spt4